MVLWKWLIPMLIAVLAVASPVGADEPRDDPGTYLSREIGEAFDSKDYARVLELCGKGLELWPTNPFFHYNAACAHCRLGDAEAGASSLLQAVRAGFNDFAHMDTDPDLDLIREHAIYVRIIEAKAEAYARVAEEQLDRARSMFGKEGYLYETDLERHLVFATALDETSHREMRAMVEKQFDYLAETLFEGPPEYFVLVAVPTPAKAGQMLNNPDIGGLYEHGHHRLIARDTGIMLRHELTHLVHFGHMERLRQSHPLWVHEGIATLFESYEFMGNGKIRFLPNSRFNTVRQAVARNREIDWATLFEMSPREFMSRSKQTYPMVRSIFRFLAEKQKLATWYQTFVKTYDEDSRGGKAFEVVFEEPLEDVERRWRNWVKGQPVLDEWVTMGDASLGVVADPNAINDGVLIDEVLNRSAASRAGILRGDVIVAINGQSVRSYPELVGLIAGMSVGDSVEVRIRRQGQYRTLVAVLQPLQLSQHDAWSPGRESFSPDRPAFGSPRGTRSYEGVHSS